MFNGKNIKIIHLLSQSGISMIGVTISIGLVGLLSVAVMRMTTSSAQLSLGAQVKADFITASTKFQTKFFNKEFCEKNIVGQISDPQPAGDVRQKIDTIKNIDNSTLYDIDTDGVDMGAVNLFEVNFLRPKGEIPVYLELKFRKTNSKALGGDLTRRIMLQAKFDSTGKIVESCYSDLSNVVNTVTTLAVEQFKGSITDQVYKDDSNDRITTTPLPILSTQRCRLSTRRCNNTSSSATCSMPSCPADQVNSGDPWRQNRCVGWDPFGICLDNDCYNYQRCGPKKGIGGLF